MWFPARKAECQFMLVNGWGRREGRGEGRLEQPQHRRPGFGGAGKIFSPHRWPCSLPTFPPE